MSGVIKHDQSLSLAMIPVVMYSCFIVTDNITEVLKTGIRNDLHVHFFSPKPFEAFFNIFSVLFHVFNVLETFKAWPFSKLIVPSIFYYAPIVEIWLKDIFLLSFDHACNYVLNRANSICLDLLLIGYCLRFLRKLIHLSTGLLVSCSQEGFQLIDFELLFL